MRDEDKLPGMAILQQGLDSSWGRCSWGREQHGGDVEKRKRKKRRVGWPLGVVLRVEPGGDGRCQWVIFRGGGARP